MMIKTPQPPRLSGISAAHHQRVSFGIDRGNSFAGSSARGSPGRHEAFQELGQIPGAFVLDALRDRLLRLSGKAFDPEPGELHQLVASVAPSGEDGYGPVPLADKAAGPFRLARHVDDQARR